MSAERVPSENENVPPVILSVQPGGGGRQRGLVLRQAEPWPTPVNGAGLLDWLRDTIHKYVVCPRHGAEMLALWVLHTYAFHLRAVTTYIGVVSPQKRCGKTTLLTLLSQLANRAIVASNISPPALFRVIEEAEPTLLIDEADTFLQGNDELRGILNAGYSRETAYVVRVDRAQRLSNEDRGRGRGTSTSTIGDGIRTEANEGNEGRVDSSRLVQFSCWCPKVMAAIGNLPETLADRCIMLTMQRKSGGERCARLRDLDPTEMRRKCARFVEDQKEKIASLRPEIPASLNDRAADIWEPLLALADLAGGEWPRLAREAAISLSGREEDESHIGVLLLYIQCLFRSSGQDRFFSRTIVATVNEFTFRPWEEKGKPIDEAGLARQLRPYGIRPKTMWIDGLAAKGYMKEDFADVFGRYLPNVSETLKRWVDGGEWEGMKNAEGKVQNAELTEGSGNANAESQVPSAES